MGNPVEFMENLVDKFGRPVWLPKGLTDIPEDIFEVTKDVFEKIVTGEPRAFKNGKGQVLVVNSGLAWLPEFTPGEQWEEVTDPEEREEILHGPDGGDENKPGNGGEDADEDSEPQGLRVQSTGDGEGVDTMGAGEGEGEMHILPAQHISPSAFGTGEGEGEGRDVVGLSFTEGLGETEGSGEEPGE